MTDRITRRDFIHDVTIGGIGLAAAMRGLGASAATAAASQESYYPPTQTGMRGTHPGAFETAHRLAREGVRFPAGTKRDEHYDLVIVGAGISGLAAAYFYRQKHGPDRKVLLLDNHDDFGGHAKRNEFHQGGALRLAWGGTVNIEHWNYSEVGQGLLRSLGIDVERLLEDFEYDWGSSGTGLANATWFDEATYGRDALVKGFSFGDFSVEALREALPDMPLSEEALTALRVFVDRDDDVLAGSSEDQRETYLRSTSYTDFLRHHGGLPDEAIQIFSASMPGIWGVRAEESSIAECLETGLPGAHILNIEPSSYFERDHGPSAMFPDGNASIARLLVRALIPAAFPDMPADRDPFQIVTALADYSQLDREGSDARLRLNSTVVHVENNPSGGVNLTYAKGDALHTVTADQCVLACYNRIIPYLCPSLPEEQKAALGQCIKRPMGTVNVVLKNGRAIEKSGVSSAYLPGSFLQLASVVSGFSVGEYESSWDPDETCVLHFFFGVSAENPPEGLSLVEQSQAGRLRLLAMDFDDFETEVRRVLKGIWGPSGLNVDTDILAITVNRWPHGYARDLMDLEDPAWLASPGPYEIGRQRFGNITIANSDAGADAYTHTAIDQAWRAVQELPAT